MVKVVLNWIFVREGDRKDPTRGVESGKVICGRGLWCVVYFFQYMCMIFFGDGNSRVGWGGGD